MTVSDNQEIRRPHLPKRIERLSELANNLWWSWHEEGKQVFRSLDYVLWRTSGNNPVKLLTDIDAEKLESAGRDPVFLRLYDSVLQRFDADMSMDCSACWIGEEGVGGIGGQIAYFSAEYAIHNSLPIYAGGLGALAGDICKESSDQGLPLVAVGFMYPQGYFHQHISSEGEQKEVYTNLNFNEAPISPCAYSSGCSPLIPIQLSDRELYVKVWQVSVGRISVYLLDTDVEENSPRDRSLSSRLYTPDQEERLRQLIVLGFGGVRALAQLGIDPIVWHANEDHTAFMMLERLRKERAKGIPIDAAIENVRRCTVFTTHTPVPAGHHVFPAQLLDRYSKNLWESIGVDRELFLSLGQYKGLDCGKFNLTAFALRLSIQSNAVSYLHGEVTRAMWQVLWNNKSKEQIPILSITNGVHLPGWQAPEIGQLFEKYVGPLNRQKQEDSYYWNRIAEIPDRELWQVHHFLKNRLINTIKNRARQRLSEEIITPQQVIAMGSLLDPYALTIAFTRRFTEYKRPCLILSDLERLRRIITNSLKPVQIIFAGKSHPADHESKQLLKRVYQVAMDLSFQGRIAFVEDYDLNIARALVRGVDIWLNTPRRLQEACGTSGMKAAINGVINLSVRDGWWDEAYNGKNGWAIGNLTYSNTADENENDAKSLYGLLENEIVPLYYDCDRLGVPCQWMRMVKEAMRTVSPVFNACRMMKEYTRQMYLSAAKKRSAI
jgi:glycogen phosphorylase